MFFKIDLMQSTITNTILFFNMSLGNKFFFYIDAKIEFIQGINIFWNFFKIYL